MQAEMKWEVDGQQWFLTPGAHMYARPAHKTQGQRSPSRGAAARRVAQAVAGDWATTDLAVASAAAAAQCESGSCLAAWQHGSTAARGLHLAQTAVVLEGHAVAGRGRGQRQATSADASCVLC
jgi:hypothetical protein